MKNLIIYSTELEQENKLNTIDNLHHVSITDEDPVTPNYDPIIRFEDPICKQVMVEAFGNKDIKGEITYREAANVTNEEFNQKLNYNDSKGKNISILKVKKFNELIYFTSLTRLGDIDYKPVKSMTFKKGMLEEITIPKNITTLGYILFQMCKNLKKVIVLGQPVIIKSQCFYGLNYPEINIDFSKVEILEAGCFYSKVIFKNPIINLQSLKSISDYVFYHQCTTKEDRLKGTIEKVINYPLDYIPIAGFNYQMNLKEFDLSKIKYIRQWAFNHCQQLKVDNLDSIVYIGDYAFDMIDSSYQLIAPTNRQISVTNFPNLKFVGSYGLQGVFKNDHTITFEKPCILNTGAIQDNINLNINNSKDLLYGQSGASNNKLKLYKDNIQYLSDSAYLTLDMIPKISFLGTNMLPKITSDINLDSIKFLYNCAIFNQTNLQELHLNNVNYICAYAIWNCKNLKSIYFGNKFEDIYWGKDDKAVFIQKINGMKIYFNGIEATPEQYDFLYTGNLKNMSDKSNMLSYESLIIKYITENEKTF